MEFVYWEKQSYRDIALILDISENAAGIRITRVKKKLRNLMDDLDSGVADSSNNERGAEG